jgi:hypothetical protein
MGDMNRERLLEAVGRFNRRDERYFELYDAGVVLHGFPEGVTDLETARPFYRRLWEQLPDAQIGIREIEDAGPDTLRVHFSFAGEDAVTTMRFADGRVVERWQGS